SRGRSSKALSDPPPRPTGGNTPRDLLAFLKPQRSRSSPARLRSNATIESQDAIDTALVPPLKCPSDIRNTLTVLPALPKLSPLLRREPYPCSPLHRTPPPLARLEGVASTGSTRPPKADIRRYDCDVRFVPKADIRWHECDVRFVPEANIRIGSDYVS